MYALRYRRTKFNRRKKSEKESKVLKGVQKAYVKNNIHFKNYKYCLLNSLVDYAKYVKLSSKNHTIRTVFVSKKSLSSFDDKRYLLPCLLHSYPYGSILIKEFNGNCNICS